MAEAKSIDKKSISILDMIEGRLNENFALFKRDLKYIPKIFSGKPLLCYLGWVGFHNLGDEMLFVAHQKLFADYELIPYHTKSILGILVRLNKKRFKGCILGGGTLIDLPGVWLEGTQSMLKLQLPIFSMGTGVNFRFKYQKERVIPSVSLEAWIEALNKFDYVGVRGSTSAEVLNTYLKEPIGVIGDSALALAPEALPPSPENNIIGICVGDSKEIPSTIDGEKYIDILVPFIRNWINKGFKIKLLPVYTKDDIFNQELLAKINDEQCNLLIVNNNHEDYLAETAKCTFFVGQKLHGTVAATLMRVPSLMISYHAKCLEYMRSIDMEDYTIDIQHLGSKILEEKASQLLEARDEIRIRLDKNILRYRSAQYQKAQSLHENLLK
jgi:hypothetical protein